MENSPHIRGHTDIIYSEDFRLVVYLYELHEMSSGGCRPRTEEMRRTLVRPLQAIFSCNLTVQHSSLFSRGLMRFQWTRKLMLSLQEFRSCKQQRKLARCLMPLVSKCRRSDIIATKVIRLHMRFVDRLMSDDPDLRLIHLVRDPRAMVESWRKLAARRRRLSPKQMQLNVRLICQRMMTDCRIRRQLESKYPHRILLLRYEDLVMSADAVIQNVYNGLLQLTLPSNVVDAMYAQFNSTSSNGPLGTRRSNGTAVVTRWRRTIDSTLLAYAKDTCRQLLFELNYDL